MKITVTSNKVADDKIEAEVIVPVEDVNAAIKQAYRDIAHQYNFQGFRRGRAPRPVIDGIIGREGVLATATNDLMDKVQPLMIEVLDIVPIKRPDWGEDVEPVVEGSEYKAQATIMVPPVVELDSYDAPAIHMPPEEATEAEIEEQINALLSYRATYEDDKRSKKVKADNLVAAQVVNKLNAESLAGDDRTFDLSRGHLAPEFVDALVGLKRDETQDIAWTTTQDGKETEHEATVTITQIKKLVTPELTDEFAKSAFGFDTVDELRTAIKDEIEDNKKSSLPSLKQDRAVAEFGMRFDEKKVPEEYKEQVFNELAEEVLGQLSRQGLSLDIYLKARGIAVDDFIADLHQQADERAKQSLALDALAAHLKIDVDDKELKEEFERSGVKDVKATMKQFFDDGRMPAVRQSIRRSKAVDWLADNCKVEIVDEAAEAAQKSTKKKTSTKKPAEKKESTAKKSTAKSASSKSKTAQEGTNE